MAEVVSGDLVVIVLSPEEAELLGAVLAAADPEQSCNLVELLEALGVSPPSSTSA